MEAEKKIKKVKEVKMMPKASAQAEPKKLSYEELVDVTNQLQRQGQMLYQENLQLREQRSLIRMNILIEVLKLKDMFSPEMITEVLEEVQEALYPKEEVIASPEGANTVQ